LSLVAFSVESRDERRDTSMQYIQVWLPCNSLMTRGPIRGERPICYEVQIGTVFASPSDTINLSFISRREIAQHSGFEIILVEILTTTRDRIAGQTRFVDTGEENPRAAFARDHESAATTRSRCLRCVDLDRAGIVRDGAFTMRAKRTLG